MQWKHTRQMFSRDGSGNTGGSGPLAPVSGMAKSVASVAMRTRPWTDRPTPPPMTTPSRSETTWRQGGRAVEGRWEGRWEGGWTAVEGQGQAVIGQWRGRERGVSGQVQAVTGR